MDPPTLTVFYDGLCPLCSREIAHYRRRVRDPDVVFLDLTAPDFDAAGHGLDPRRVLRVMRVKVGEDVRTGLDAFIALWQRVAGYRWLARLAAVPGVHAVLAGGYALFARVRPWLPRRRGPCVDGACGR
jgi:predicted DCC family thiol-disulfide oxidoreductase YuxK